MKAIVLATGCESRSPRRESSPTSLIFVGGLTILERVLRNAARAGVTDFMIVVGDRGEEVEAALRERLGEFPVRWLHAHDWRLGDGGSLLTARQLVRDEPFLVLAGDRLIFAETLGRLIAAVPSPSECILGVDRKRRLVSEGACAAKVRIEADRVTELGNTLDPYDGIEIGATVCHPVFFNELEASANLRDGRCECSDGLRRLAEKGSLLAHDIGPDQWGSIEDEGALDAASVLLFNSLRKPTDGPMARLFDRRLSLALTRRLASTRVTPNQVSGCVVVVGGFAAYLFAQTGYVTHVAAALLFWCSSLLDGCDGELARLKFQESRLGGWLDLWIDNLVHCMVFFGIGVGIYHETGDPLWLRLGIAAVGGVVLSVFFASWKARQANQRSGPFFVSVFGSDPPKGGALGRLRRLADTLSQRDFIFGVIFVALLGWLPYFLWAAAIGSNVYFVLLIAIELADRRSRTELPLTMD